MGNRLYLKEVPSRVTQWVSTLLKLGLADYNEWSQMTGTQKNHVVDVIK